MKKAHILIMLVVIFTLFGCGPSESVIQTAIAKTPSNTPYPTYTPNPSSTPYPTYTMLPTYTVPSTSTAIIKIVTMTNTPTPENTSTPTPTWAPFNQSGCIEFTFPSVTEADKKLFDEKLQALVGKCVKFFFDGKEYVLGTDLIYMSNASVIADDLTPPDMAVPDAYSIVWGILDEPSKKGGAWRIYLRKAEVFKDNQQPIFSADLYTVGVEGDMAPGAWKSGVHATWGSDCYWARINPNTGDIKDNHFGVGGTTVRVYEGDVFETNVDCLNWYYVGP
jgi:hypothetical protein